MIVSIKSSYEIDLMRKAGAIVRDVLELIEENVKPGITTLKLDKLAYQYIKSCNATPSFLGYGGFPNSICTSIDEEVVHGIPSNRVLKEGMLLKVDVGANYRNYHSDAARSIAIGKISDEKMQLAKVCKQSFFEGISILRPDVRLGDLGNKIQTYVESYGFSVIRDLVGHGIGSRLHEMPNVPNYGVNGRGLRLSAGMTLAIEPMINIGTHKVRTLEDNWTVVSLDCSCSAHYENTILITEDGVEILTL